MTVRESYRAGSFYERSPDACRRHAEQLLRDAEPPDDLPEPIFGGIVPHAGWVFSGGLAAKTFKALDRGGPDIWLLFGADHTGSVKMGEVFTEGVWRTPIGEAAIDEELASALLAAGDAFRANPEAHAFEHSLEVQVPLLLAMRPEARIVPVAVPPTPLAIEVGRTAGDLLRDRAENAAPPTAVLGSTDLTHHGGHFGSPGGQGAEGVEWARRNDRRMLDLIERLAAEEIITEAAERRNACGAGAIAATVAACRRLGATRGRVLEYTNSYEVLRRLQPGAPDYTTVGYASVVFA